MGTLINVAAILAGGGLGLLLRGGIPERFRRTAMQALSLCVILIGLRGALGTRDVFAVIACGVLGGLLGEALRVEDRLEALGAYAQRRFGGGADGSFAQGFVTASLVYCVGAMAVVGSLQDGLSGDMSQLLAKSALDGVSAVFFASALGPGVLLAAVPVLAYQGGITLLARALSPLLSDAVVREMSAVGGLLIVGIGLNLLEVARIRVGNLLPAILLPAAYLPISAGAARLFSSFL